MLNYVLYQRLWSAVIRRNDTTDDDSASEDQTRAPVEGDTVTMSYKVSHPLKKYTQGWDLLEVSRGNIRIDWRSTFISEDILITREELLTLVLTKLGMETSLQNLTLLVKKLRFQCFGVATLRSPNDVTRKVVGVAPGSSSRRDFVRLRSSHVEGPAWSAQVNYMSKCICYNSTYFLSKYVGVPYLQFYKLWLTGSHVCSSHWVRSWIRDSST